jgi:carboxyl-terminal processing protease
MSRYMLAIVGCLGFLSTFGQLIRDIRSEAASLKKLLSEKHLRPRTINDQFSAAVYDDFLAALDPDGLYFTATELATIEQYRTLLDDQINGEGWTFLPAITPLFRMGLERAKAIALKQCEAAFSATAKNTILFDTLRWVQTEKALQMRWRNKLHYETFEKLADLQKGESRSPQFFAKHEPEARARVKNKAVREINRQLNSKDGLDTFVAEKFLTAITAAYDPHTSYFNLTNMEVFSALVNAEDFYFGFSLKEDERGNVIISSLAPDGPAWKSGSFELHDELVAIQWVDEEVIDLTDLPLAEINSLLDDGDQMKIKFTLRKSSGELKTVELQKEKFSREENLVRGYILEGQNGQRYGYIILPQFYTEFDADDYAATRCANDVAKEIMKFNQEQVQGVILDVRNNGGGSLKEAIALGGIFLEEGAMAMMKHTAQDAILLKDMNRGTLYDGPLILMVNNRSASASEVLAAALQDYNRAVIVGSRTFGKATAQEVLTITPVDALKKLDFKGHFGFAKVTTSRIYRVTGKTWQGKGLIPDISLVDFFDVINYHETLLDNYLMPDSITKKSYYKPLPIYPVTLLRQKSEARVAASNGFKAIAMAMQVYEGEMRELKRELLIWDDFARRAVEARQSTMEIEKALGVDHDIFNARVLAAEKDRLMLDAYAKSFHDASVAAMEKDIYLGEAFLIMNDLITINKK